MSPALAGGFLTTVPPGKPFFKNIYLFGCTGSYLQQAGSLVVACELLVAACMWDPVP